MRILIAEDDDSNYLLITIILRMHDVTRAVNGVEAVEKAKEGGYDMVLMDIRMPQMDGVEATKEIRKFDQKIPIIAVTANAFDSDRNIAINAGCNDFLSKPINRTKLFETIDKYQVK